MYHQSVLNEYKSIDIESRVSASTPHSLVAMLLDGLLKKMVIAVSAIQRNDVKVKGENISSSIRIIDNLRASLDHQKGGEISLNLAALYDYMERRLLEANLKSDPAILNEVSSLIEEIKSGWDAIPNEQRGG